MNKLAVIGFGTMGRDVIDILSKTDLPVAVKDEATAPEPGRQFVRGVLEETAAAAPKKKRSEKPVKGHNNLHRTMILGNVWA